MSTARNSASQAIDTASTSSATATWRTDYRTLEVVLQPGAPIFTRRSFVVEEGSPALLDG